VRARLSEAPAVHLRDGDVVQLLESLGLPETAATLATERRRAQRVRGDFVSPDILVRALAEALAAGSDMRQEMRERLRDMMAR